MSEKLPSGQRYVFGISQPTANQLGEWLAEAWDAGYSAAATDESAGNVACPDCATTNPYRQLERRAEG